MKRLKEFRESKGYTVEELADMVGVSRQIIYDWEKGKSYPNVFNALKLAKIFGVSVADLIGGQY